MAERLGIRLNEAYFIEMPSVSSMSSVSSDKIYITLEVDVNLIKFIYLI